MAIGVLVEGMRPLACRIVGDDRQGPTFDEQAPQPVAVVSGVASQAAAGRDSADQGQCDANVAKLAGRYFERNGRPRESTIAWIFVVRPPRERPIACASAPFPPAAER